ncbi:hypothetical protein U1Q18_041253 [Sarracenia purpurea var. burkii]
MVGFRIERMLSGRLHAMLASQKYAISDCPDWALSELCPPTRYPCCPKKDIGSSEAPLLSKVLSGKGLPSEELLAYLNAFRFYPRSGITSSLHFLIGRLSSRD